MSNKIWNYLPSEGDCIGAIIEKHRFVCEFITDPNKNDANLMVAAPVLYEKLENLVIAIGMGWDLDGVCDEALTALAKARGE